MAAVCHNGMLVSMTDDAMAELGWVHGQQINEPQLSEALQANARSFCREMDRRRAQGLDAPDTADLAALAGHTGTH